MLSTKAMSSVAAIIILICMTKLVTVKSYALSYADPWAEDNQLSGARDSLSTYNNNHVQKDIPLGLMNLFQKLPKASSTDENSSSTAEGKHRKKGSLGHDEFGRVQMGVPTDHCDDGKTNLTMDWDYSSSDYTCFHPESPYPVDVSAEPTLECEVLPDSYRPEHFCMDKHITYDQEIPSYGPHRPLWPKFGEYLYVPRERWLHNIEHGAVVMLYHPCTQPMEVKRLKRIVKECVGKYIITPSTLVPRERPLALVAWGCKLLMPIVDDDMSKNFIREKALHGPEGTYPKEGQYTEGLIEFSNRTGNAIYDRVLC